MAKNRIRRRKKVSKKKKSRDRSDEKSQGDPDGLTMDEMLARIPEGKEWLSTSEVRHVFNDCHVVTVYKMNGKELKPYRRAASRGNFYHRDNVEQAVRGKFRLIPVSGEGTDGIYEASAVRGRRGRPKKKSSARRKAK